MLHDFKTEIKIFVVVLIVAVIIAVGGIWLLSQSQTSLPAVLSPGEEINTSGVVVEKNTGCYVDGICSLTVDSDRGRLEVIYNIGWGVCDNENSTIADSLDIGDEVEIFGMVESTDTVSACSAPEYYIKSVGFVELQTQESVLFGTEAEGLCGSQPPAICQSGQQLGCDIEEKQWDCFPVDSTSTEFDGWQTYRNDEFGFEFRYPRDWVLNSNYEVPPGGGPIMTVIASIDKDRYVYGVGLQGIVPYGHAAINFFKAGDTVIEDGSYIVNFGTATNGDEIMLVHTWKRIVDWSVKKEMQIQMVYWEGDPNTKEFDKIFDELLSTFRFVEE